MSERLLPEDIPRWFIPFARHVLRCCGQSGRYFIELDVPSKDDQCREIIISRPLRLRMALLDNAERRRIDHERLRPATD